MSERKTLPAIIKESTEIVQALIELGGELPPELELAQELNEAALVQKADQYGYVLAELEAREEFLKKRAKDYSDAAAICVKAQSSIEDRMKWAMEQLQTKEICGDETRFLIQNNPPKVEIENEAQIPGVYFVSEVKTSLDKKALSESLKSGQDVPGAKLVRGTRIARKINTVKPVKVGA